MIGVKKQNTIHVLVPHHAQRFYDPDADRKYEFTVTHQLLEGWELDGDDAEMIATPKEYVVNKRPSADKIADTTKKPIYTLKLKKKIAVESGSNDNSSEAEYDYAVYKIIIYTPSISLTLHAPDIQSKVGEKLKRPTTKEADTVEGFDTGYLGVMLRNEDNDDGKIPDSDKPHPRDNDDGVIGSTDDDLVAVLMELNVPDGMPDELKILTQVNLLFKKSKDKQIRVFDIGKSEVKLADLSEPKNLTEAGGDKHLGELIEKGKATIYLEGLGSSEKPSEPRWGDEVDQVTLCLTPGGEYKEASSHGLLLQVQAAVDYNRDGDIKFGGSDRSTKENPYQFWVNDDIDKGHVVDQTPFGLFGSDYEEDDLDPSKSSQFDSDEAGIKFKRDLEDFTRIWVDLTNLQKVYGEDLEGVTISMETKTTEVDDGLMKINLFRAVEDDGDRMYLKEETIGDSQIEGVYSKEIIGPTSNLIENDLPRAEIDKAIERDGKLYFLFEGHSPGKGEVIFKFKKGETEAVFPSIHLELHNVSDMYETYSVGDVTEPLIQWDNTMPASSASQTSGQDLPAPETEEEKDYILFIHGWNMPPWEKEAFASAMYKRLWHQGYKGRFGAFRWPTFHSFNASALITKLQSAHYDGSEQRAWASATPLAKLIKDKSQTFKDSSGSLVRCYAHSMGNVVTSEALRILKNDSAVHTYISAQGAIPADVWDRSVPQMGNPESPPNAYGYYWQNGASTTDPREWKDDKRPSYMDQLYMPLGAIYINHYNKLDWALEHWETGQKLKPDVDYQWERIGLSSNYAFTHNTGWATEEILKFPDDRHEIFSFAAQAWSFATGAEGATGGMFNIGKSINLNGTQYNFGEKHKGHSAQFRSTIQKRWSYWEQAMNDMQVPGYN